MSYSFVRRKGELLSAVLVVCCALDKQLHFFASYGIQMTATMAFKEFGYPYPELWAMGATLAVGVMKEAADPVFSKGDLAADTIGAGSAALFSYTVRW